jgi:hypothetical protein
VHSSQETMKKKSTNVSYVDHNRHWTLWSQMGVKVGTGLTVRHKDVEYIVPVHPTGVA